ncbi:hypothetical protein [Exiguobacterium sp. SRB7LM]|uniref:hypothetical protein n=1 Tax=Exiguobacterium sp. SRB7LM TaxID=2608401 RepID=UPI0018C3F9B7|nr:hypothetical protein [Exiguobacterium sp. SRB7LM]MBG0917842.1 hypothetical protein [Exiguobacterium sp. SRB7LM]
MAKKKQFVTAAAAFAVAASAVAPAITADAASTTVQLSSDYVRGGDLDAALDKEYKGSEIYWYKSSVDMNKLGVFQTAKGFVKGQGIRVEKKLRVLNHAQDIQPEEIVLEEGVPASGLRIQPVLFADGVKYNKVVTYKGFSTEKAGEFEGTFTYSNKAFGVVTKTVKYKVVASKVELSEVKSEVMDDVLSVTADVKNLKDGEKVELVVYANRDMNAALPAVQAEVKDGKLSVKSGKLPAGNHSFILRSGEVKTDVMNFVVEAPMVKDVKAINGKDHVVEFNKSVDKITAENKANYEISVNNGAALAAADYTVAVDEKDPTKVKITLADGSALSNGAYVSVKVKKAILDTNLKPLADDFTKTFTFVDNSAATIEKVEVDGSNLKVTFNDYVSAVGLVKVNGVVVDSADLSALSPYSKELVITGGATGLANGTYSVQIANVKDIANVNSGGVASPNLTTFTSGNFTISNVTVAPTVSKVEKVDENTFKITFNKAVTAPTVTTKKNGLSLDTTVNATGDAKVWNVDVADNGGVLLYNTGETSVNLALNISGFKAVSDNVVGDAVNQSVTLSKDTAGPVVETRFNEIVDVDATGTVDEVFNIKFNEVIQNPVQGNIILTDKDGIRRTVTSATIVADANGANTILQVKSTAIQTAGAINAGTYTLSLGAGTVEDLAGNDLSSTVVSFTKSTGTTTDFAVTATAAANVITLPFGTPMTNSAIDLSNYKLDNKALPAGTIAYFDGSKQQVKIELPAGTIARSQDAVLTVSSSVVSEAGAKLDTASRNQVISGLIDNVKPTLVSAKKLTSTTVEVTFSENLAAVVDAANTQDDFVVKVNGVNFAVTAVADGTANDNKVVLTVADYNVDQTLTVAMADATINIADIATNTVEAKTVVTATK